MSIPKGAQVIMNTLRQAGFECYLVGGCVRDMQMGKEPHDYDMTTSALPQEMVTLFEGKGFHTIATGLKHGTLTILVDHEPYEVTTYRVDGTYTDNRHPDQVNFTRNLQEDLSRRDFTINAMAYNPESGLVDIFGGQHDLRNKVIACVGSPDKRFGEDGLRILRALRFASVLNFTIREDVSQSIHRNKDLLKNISVERIWVELGKLVMGPGAESILLNYADVFEIFLPEIHDCVGFNQNSRWHCYDVWTHTVKAMVAAPTDRIIRLALLFHDLGKPDCYSEDQKGGHFYGHHKISAQKANAALHRLKVDNETREEIVRLVDLHDTVFTGEKKQLRKLILKTSPQTVRRLLQVHRGDVAAQAVENRESRLRQSDELEALLEQLLSEENCFSLKDLAINGTDLMQQGWPAGPILGQILNRLLNEVMEEKIENDKEILLARASKLFRKEGKP